MIFIVMGRGTEEMAVLSHVTLQKLHLATLQSGKCIPCGMPDVLFFFSFLFLKEIDAVAL